MGFCKDCRHWEEHSSTRGNVSKVWNTCEVIRWVAKTDPVGETEFAIYADASDDTGLDAGLKTGPLFGCNKFALPTPDLEDDEFDDEK